MTRLKPYDRILDATTELLYEDGIHLSVNSVVAKADVALMTVYRHFKGKDELVTAALELWSARWLSWLRTEIDRYGEDPTTRYGGLWSALEGWFSSENYRGSLIALTSIELRNSQDHPAQKVVAAHRIELRQFLADLASAAGANDPERLAAQLEILVVGATVIALADHGRAIATSLRPLANAALATARACDARR
jgi:AcrR family transcriptional regulator